MSAEPVDGGPPRRYLIATAVSTYRDPAWNVPGLDDSRRQIVELFTGRLGYEHVSTLGLDPTRDQLRSAIRAFCRDADRRPDDLLAVYVSGHGQVLDDTEHILLTSDTDPADVGFSALPTAELAEVMLRETGIRRVLLMLDVCYAEQGGNRLAASALESMGASWSRDPGSGLVVISAARPHQPAKAGLFPRVLAEAVEALPVAGHGPPHLSVNALVTQMNTHPELPGWQRVGLSMVGLDGQAPPFFANPRYDRRLTGVDLAIQEAAEFEEQDRARDIAFEGTMLIRAMAYPDEAKPGWWFTGRATALTEVSHWLHGTAPVCVVTAGPGSGKSAVLGLLAALTHGTRRPAVPATSLGLAPEQFPADSVDVVVYAQHMTNTEVIEALAAAARVSASSVGELVTELSRRERTRPFTAIIDGLDEAATPESLCADVLRHLIRHADGHVRLLLGTRPYLLERLGVGPDETVDLDSERHADPEALQAYAVRMLIESRRESPYRGAADVLGVATAVAEAAGTSFLVARIVSGTLAAAEQAVASPQDPRWRRSLPRYADQAMVEDLERRLGADATRATDLLRPLAFAQGEGLPWENLWAPLASAMSGCDYTDDDLLWLRRTAGSYVVETTEHGRSTYRLYHQALAEHLATGTDEAEAHRAFVDALVASVPYRADAIRDWGRAHPYVLSHLAAHAAHAGRLDEVLQESEYLVHAVPRGLTPHLRHVASEQARLIASVYRSYLDAHRHLDPAARRQILALAAAGEGMDPLCRRLIDRIPAGGWFVRWTSKSATFSSALRDVLADGPTFTRAVACTTIGEIPIAATAGSGSVRLWNLRTGAEHGEPFRYWEVIRSIACAVVDGDPTAVTGGMSRIRVFNLRTRRSFTYQIGDGLSIRALTCGEVNAVPVVLAIDDNGTLHVSDLRTGRPHQPPISLGKSALSEIAYADIDGVPTAAVANDDKLLMVDLHTGRQTDLRRGDHSVFGLVCTVIDDTPVAVTTGTKGLQVWDLRKGRIHSTLDPNPSHGHITALPIGGKPTVITAADDGRITVWDLRTDTRLGDPVITGASSIYSVTSTTVDGIPVAITVDDSRGTGHVARVWDIEPDQSHSTGSTTSGTSVPAASTFVGLGGATVAVITGWQGLRMWNTETGESHGIPDIDYSTKVISLTLDGDPIVITLGKSVRAWNLQTRERLGEPIRPTLDRIRSLAGTELKAGSHVLAGVGGGALWRLRSGPYDEQLISDDVGRLAVVACALIDGDPIAVVGSFDEAPQAWNLRTGDLHAVADRQAVEAVSCSLVDGLPVAVLSGPFDVRLWDLATGQVHRLATLPGETANSVTCSPVDGTSVATTAHSDGVRIWDLNARELVDWIPLPNPVNATLTNRGDLAVVFQRGISVFGYRH